MKKKLNVGIVGCGEIAQISHIPYLLELPFFHIGAICDLSSLVVEELGNKYNIKKRYLDYGDLVKDKEIDIVLVSNKNHADVSVLALENGKHVFIEKPISLNLRQADEILHALKSNDRKLMVGYMKRFDPAYEVMKKEIAGIEKVHLIRLHDFAGSYDINNEIYNLVKPTDINNELMTKLHDKNKIDMLVNINQKRTELINAYDIMIHLCIHDINLLAGLIGLPKNIEYAKLFDNNFITAVLAYENGINLIWESGNLVTLQEWDENLTFYGSNKLLSIEFPFPYLKNAATIIKIKENQNDLATRKQIITSYDEAYRREWIHFYDCIINNRTPETNAQQARDDLEFAIELFNSAIGY